MANDNHVTLIGNCTRDPELRYTNSGMSVASFGVAIGQRKRNPDTGQWEDGDTSFFDITCFRELAENVAESITKGTRVIVSGNLRQRSWETDNGERRSKVEVIADEVAPSLRWATANVTRNERRGGGDFGGGGGGRSSAPAGGSDMYDEEPF